MKIFKNGQANALGAWENLQPIFQTQGKLKGVQIEGSAQKHPPTWRMHRMYVNLLDICAA
jgi:hypothetical protein